MKDAVRFEIERLTLHGFSRSEQPRILAAIRAELTTLGTSGALNQRTSRADAAAHVTTRIQAATARPR